MKVTKYSNRKLYSHELRRYVTLKDVIDAVRGGGSILAVTKNDVDVTASVLAQAICTEIASGSVCSTAVLIEIIRAMKAPPAAVAAPPAVAPRPL